ncbi:MAG: thioredoxin-disulfide reductase [Endomicrobia bacterium]|nr:thioredoxin-disulfide reductase [Endomicrobiia bacterium]MDW8055454.1 thioredoxin-disulfide reductase [Elusimicrobiota bacterium]
MNNKVYDVIIIGGGPAGYSAGIYTARAMLKTLIITSFIIPTQVVLTDVIENYPGFPEGINGFDFIEKLKQQAEKFGTEILTGDVTKIEKFDNGFKISLSSSNDFFITNTVIIATGRKNKKLGIEDEEKFIGRGISYCAVCDGALYKNKTVAIIGGGNTAFTEAIFLTKYVKKLYIIHRREQFRAIKILQQQLLTKENVETITPYVVEKIIGENSFKGIILKNVLDNTKKELYCDGMFVCIGYKPNTEFLTGLVKMDEEGYIITDEKLQTSVEGIYACGDCREGSVKQIVNACAEGVHAALSVISYIQPY